MAKVNNDKEIRRDAMLKLIDIAKKRGLTPDDMAKGSGIGFTSIYMFQNGTRTPSMDAICRLADLLKIEVEIVIKK